MNVFVVFSLSGEVPGVAICPGCRPEAAGSSFGKSAMVYPAMLEKGGVRPVRKEEGFAAKCARLEEENRLMKEELNELYVRYDRMCAAFGEMNHFVAEAAAAAGRFPGEEDEA